MSGETTTVYAMFIVNDGDAKQWRGAGRRGFAVLPRVGEHVELADDDGKGQLYKVVAVCHGVPTENRDRQVNDTGIDVYAVRDSETVDFLRRLLSEVGWRNPDADQVKGGKS